MVAAPWQPLAAHHARRLAGEGRKQDLAVDALGEMLGERRLAGSGITEEAKDGRAPAGGFEPIRSRGQGGILVRREDRHRRLKRRSAGIKNITGTFVKCPLCGPSCDPRMRTIAGHHPKKNRTVEAAASAAPRVASR